MFVIKGITTVAYPYDALHSTSVIRLKFFNIH